MTNFTHCSLRQYPKTTAILQTLIEVDHGNIDCHYGLDEVARELNQLSYSQSFTVSLNRSSLSVVIDHPQHDARVIISALPMPRVIIQLDEMAQSQLPLLLPNHVIDQMAEEAIIILHPELYDLSTVLSVALHLVQQPIVACTA
ncbi:hypothetical protein VST7929_02879 [Vibrio stylophorae]|uniref:AraC family transcriptional regulator n=1 Tax=Vibrio stylophorae TaxID=659351 RepID=A0ABM8ZX62_9VIBR|nr:hypothetical protein [Vibrio stylophorae]CAH0535228.1 hypothetical protein VST7929_02879 [Vibrio stylophorae]